MAKRILGIDPGSRATGYAVLEQDNTTFRLIACDVIKAVKIESQAGRLQYIFDEITSVIKEFGPDECAIETPVYGVDPLAMHKLGRAQAASILAITNQKLTVAEYYPKAVKKSVTGNGNASKQQVAFMLEKVLKIDASALSEDATDALAVAWCHFMGRSATGENPSGKKMHQNNSRSGWAQFIRDNPGRVKEN